MTLPTTETSVTYPDGATDIPCGGTQLTDIADVSAITVSLTADQVEGGLELTMQTTTTRR